MHLANFYLFIYLSMFGRSLVNAASFSSFGQRSSLKKNTSVQNLAELAAACEDEEVPSIDDSIDSDYFEAYLPHESPTCISAAPGLDFEPLALPSQITLDWIKSALIPSLQRGFEMNRAHFERFLYWAETKFSKDDTIHALYFDETKSLIVVGDIHGAFDAMLESIFDHRGYPGEDLFYVFNGDLVDRGPKSLECLMLALALKIAAPTRFFVTRGNHESMTVGRGSFYTECQQKLTGIEDAFEQFHRVFKQMPVGYLVNRRYFIAHGGLCPELNLWSLRMVNRTRSNFEQTREFMALLWNDPVEEISEGHQVVPTDFDEARVAIAASSSLALDKRGMGPNSRGLGCETFSRQVTTNFLARHGLKMFIRSHQFAKEGYQFNHNRKCLTIFSSPDYLGMSNEGALLHLRYNQPPILLRMERKEISVNQSEGQK